MGSPLPSPDKKKFSMKIRGDCFLYTSFYMIKKWFLVLVAVNNYPQFQKSLQKMFTFQTKDKWFVVGLIFASPVLIPIACLFVALALLLLVLLLLTFVMAVILLFILIIVLDLPLLLVLLIQGLLFAELLTNLNPIIDLDWFNYLIYLQLALICVIFYNALQEVSNASDNMLFFVQHYKKRKEESSFYWFFILMSILPQILQIVIMGFLSYFSPQVLLSTLSTISAFQNFSFLYIIIKVNAFMTTFLRETKWHNLHWVLFKYLEDNKKVNKIHVQADEVDKKIYELKREKVYQYKGYGFRFDRDFLDDIGIYVVKSLFKLTIFGLFLGAFASNLYDYYNNGSSDSTSTA